MHQSRVDAIVLAGGSSSRMGRDKALIELDGKTLLSRVLDAASGLAQVDRIVVVGWRALPERYGLDLKGIECIPDEVPGLGPLAGVASGLARVGTDHALVLACDAPWPQQLLVSALVDRAVGADAVVPCWNDRPQVLFAVYARSLLQLMRSALDDGIRSVSALLDRVPRLELMSEETARNFDPSGLSFANLNTPEDLARVAEQRSPAAPAGAPTVDAECLGR
jgi:molybdopterin-guanine dinucleotide biosynthesis protein A